jgi:hypothetical protein
MTVTPPQRRTFPRRSCCCDKVSAAMKQSTGAVRLIHPDPTQFGRKTDRTQLSSFSLKIR